MPYTAPAAVTSGAVISKTTFGDVVIADLNFLANKPACRVTASASQTINDNTVTTVTFNTEEYDTDTMHDTVTNNSRITIKTAGVFAVVFHGLLANNSDYQASYAQILKNGAFVAKATDNGVSDGGGPALQVVDQFKCAVNDYLEIQVFHNNTGNTSRALSNQTFAATWLTLG
jgi:hypothetical protein